MRIYSLNKITPGDTTPAAVNSENAAIPGAVNKVQIQAHKDNTGAIHWGVASDMDRTTSVGVCGTLEKGESQVVGDEVASNPIDPGDIYVIAENGTDAVIGFAMER